MTLIISFCSVFNDFGKLPSDFYQHLHISTNTVSLLLFELPAFIK